jgi:hypothetical protein
MYAPLQFLAGASIFILTISTIFVLQLLLVCLFGCSMRAKDTLYRSNLEMVSY